MSRPQNRQALSDVIYDKITARIIRGKLQPGQRITEMQIANREGVSQAPVREALKRLAEDRLVTLKPRSGCFVCKITAEEANYLFDIRQRLESLAIELAMRKLAHEQASELLEKLLDCRQLPAEKLVRRALVLDDEFHTFLCEASGSEDLQRLVAKLRARIQVLRAREARDSSRARESLGWHIRILEAMVEGNRKKALADLHDHIEETRRSVVARFTDSNGEQPS